MEIKSAIAGEGADYLRVCDQNAATGRVIGRNLVAAQTRHCLRRNATASAQLQKLRMACIMDDFTWLCFAPECKAIQLLPQNCVPAMAAFRPHLLFVESAWQGLDKAWKSKVSPVSCELLAAIAWCRAHHVPTVFWNKEDPVHYATFLPTAKLFDFVFTTDVGRVASYRQDLGHDRAFFLPFATQPRHFNPLEKYQRKRACCFAGSWYSQYPRRCVEFRELAVNLRQDYPLEIWDRNYKNNIDLFRFPHEYQPLIQGTLPAAAIDRAYKGYQCALTMNTVKQSQTMFARRALELMACNTLVISNYAAGLRFILGDLAICTDNGAEMLRQLRALDDLARRKRQLAALRKAMREHCARSRLARIAEKVFGRKYPGRSPLIHAISLCASLEEAGRVAASFLRQGAPRKRLTIFLPKSAMDADALPFWPHCRLYAIEDYGARPPRLLAGDWLAPLLPCDWHGDNYLPDLLLATRYWQGDVIGKGEYFHYKNGKITREHGGIAYRETGCVFLRAAMFRPDVIAGSIAQLFARATRGDTVRGLAVDPFNYCLAGAADASQAAAVAGDHELADTGADFGELYEFADAIEADTDLFRAEGIITAAELGRAYVKSNDTVSAKVVDNRLEIESGLAEGEHRYFYGAPLPVEAGPQSGDRIVLRAQGQLDLGFVLLYRNAREQKVKHQLFKPGIVGRAIFPGYVATTRIGIRLQGPGKASIERLEWGDTAPRQPQWLIRKRALILTTHYPGYDDLYKNAFIHMRAKAYKQAGLVCDVFCLHPSERFEMREFQGIDVMTGDSKDLDCLLAANKYEIVLVHLLNAGMWRSLAKYPDVPKIVWVHGIEIQPAWRRAFNFHKQAELDEAVRKGEARMALWREVLAKPRVNLHFVFVSQYFMKESLADVGVAPPGYMRSVIPNYINGELFAYAPKPAELRKKILSIRPFASRAYANDLSVKAILALAREPFFSELQFRIIGDGELFERETAPLRELGNVRLERRFVTQAEIAALHREHGVFLCPTRMDSQGVSRDEAMASGLVPVTNAVEAVPEFVDESCAMLARGEDWRGLAAGIRRLYEQPELFVRMSGAASARVRAQSGWEETIGRELELIERMRSGISEIPRRAVEKYAEY